MSKAPVQQPPLGECLFIAGEAWSPSRGREQRVPRGCTSGPTHSLCWQQPLSPPYLAYCQPCALLLASQSPHRVVKAELLSENQPQQTHRHQGVMEWQDPGAGPFSLPLTALLGPGTHSPTPSQQTHPRAGASSLGSNPAWIISSLEKKRGIKQSFCDPRCRLSSAQEPAQLSSHSPTANPSLQRAQLP